MMLETNCAVALADVHEVDGQLLRKNLSGQKETHEKGRQGSSPAHAFSAPVVSWPHDTRGNAPVQDGCCGALLLANTPTARPR